MKPIVFKYANVQKSNELPMISYCKEKQLNLLNGEIFVNLDDAGPVSKTFSEREGDDEPRNININYLSKTDTQRESDDQSPSYANIAYFLTKTESNREADE